MTANTSNSSESHIDVRFSKFYAIIIILLSHAPLIFAAQQIISLKQEFFLGSNFIIPSIAILVGLLIILTGLSQPNRWHFRLDRDNKMLMVSYGISSWSKKYPYDSISFAGGKFHIEISGVEKKIGFVKFTCNRNDLKLLVLALKETS
ncbi:MAG: hypothetical protein E4H10_07165 [Bacteroidia bacterium]|nr:MAG: hypothetical protein E4H10_07165 [Bacteroidia bacterium]